MKGSAWGGWDPQKGQQPFRPKPNGVWDRTTTWRRLLMGADFPLSLGTFSTPQDLVWQQHQQRAQFSAVQKSVQIRHKYSLPDLLDVI